MSPASPRPEGRRVNVFQALALLVTFALTAGVGGVLAAGLVMPAVATTNVVTETSVRLFEDLPSELEPQELPQQSRIWAGDTLLATFFWQNRIEVPLEDISQAMIDAVVATEDHRFFDHGGVDVAGMARALVVNVTTDELEGASTLTQQYVKNVQIEAANAEGDVESVRRYRETDGAAGVNRKLQEAKLAVSLEQRMTKDQILQGYLNIAQFGASVYGVEAAARQYFSVSAKDLNYLQAATIAGITQAPNAHDPLLNPESSQNRRNHVLSRMRIDGKISQEEYDHGVATPLPDTLNPSSTSLGCVTAGGAAFFCDYVTKEIMQAPEFGETRRDRLLLLERGGLDIYTTIDLRLQAMADEELRSAVPVDDASGLANAMVSVEPGTGRILTMAQNRNFNPRTESGPGETSVNYAADYAHGNSRGFPVGSTFKTFVLAEWLESGKSLNTVVDGNRREWRGTDWTAGCIGPNPNFYANPWDPANFDGQGRGPMTVAAATYNSINTAYMSMSNQLDLCGIAEMAAKVGFDRADGQDIQVVPSTSLGSEESSPLSMANAYATFAAGGVYCDPVAITRVTDSHGNDLDIPDANCRQVVDPAVAATVTHALTGVMTQGSGRAAQLAGRPSAGKTGTTNENRHSWFIGYTPQLSTAYWMGNADVNTPMRNVQVNGQWHRLIYGSTIAAPTWKRFMDRALEGEPAQSFPSPDQRLVEGERVAVPGVSGRSVAQATATLEERGFSVRVREQPAYARAARGSVAYTDPQAGARVPAGSMVTLILSAGPDPNPPPSDDDGDDADDSDDDSSRSGPGRGNGNGNGGGGGRGRGGD